MRAILRQTWAGDGAPEGREVVGATTGAPEGREVVGATTGAPEGREVVGAPAGVTGTTRGVVPGAGAPVGRDVPGAGVGGTPGITDRVGATCRRLPSSKHGQRVCSISLAGFRCSDRLTGS